MNPIQYITQWVATLIFEYYGMKARMYFSKLGCTECKRIYRNMYIGWGKPD